MNRRSKGDIGLICRFSREAKDVGLRSNTLAQREMVNLGNPDDSTERKQMIYSFIWLRGAQEMHANSQFPESAPLHESRVSDKKNRKN
jgi:hypothetical protein